MDTITINNNNYQIGNIAKNKYQLLQPLIISLNPTITTREFNVHLTEILKQPNYSCIGIWYNNNLIACCGYWLLYKFYNGKHIEVDNVAVLPNYRNLGLGKILMQQIHNIAAFNNCKIIELNAYVHNNLAHKFYLNLGYKILGYHFQKTLNVH